MHRIFPHNATRAALCLVVAALMACAFLALAGCKYSDVLTEHVEDPVNGRLDEAVEALYQEAQDAPQDPTKMSARLADTDERIDEQTSELPDYDEDTQNEQESSNYEQQDDSAHDQTATSGNKASDKQRDDGSTRKTDEKADGEGQSPEESDEGDSDERADGEADGGEAGNKGDAGSDGAGGGEGQIYDPSTNPEKLPDNTATVAAAGQYATIVQMLSGNWAQNRVLVAADSDWVARVAEFGAFSGEGTEQVAAGWTGDGSEQNADLSAIEAARPDAVLVDGNESALSEGAVEELRQQGVNVLVMPTLGKVSTKDSDITTAVQIVGALLSGVTGGASATNAANYVQAHDDALNKMRDTNGGYSYKTTNGSSYAYIYQGDDATAGTATTSLSSKRITTVFIDSFFTELTASTVVANRHTGSAQLWGDGQTLEVSGVGLSAASSGFALMDYYLQNAGVVNNAYNRAAPQAAPYAIAAGDVGEKLLSGKETAQRDVPSALWYSPTGKDSDFLTVGASTFPSVVCRDAATAKGIAASRDSANGFYNVGQHYTAVVMPEGLAGSWADGTIESFLLAPWALGYLYGIDGTTVQQTVDTYPSYFYEHFYRCSDGLSALKAHGYAEEH